MIGNLVPMRGWRMNRSGSPCYIVDMTGYGQFCSMARAHEVLGGRWTLLIVREILCGSRRFNDIRRGIPRVSRTVLSERLQALVFVGAIIRTDGPHGPEYELTEAGQELASLVSALGTWGQRWLAREPAKEDRSMRGWRNPGRWRSSKCRARRRPDARVRYHLSRDGLHHALGAGEEGAERFLLIISQESRMLLAFDRYERRALSRRKSAIRALDEARSA